MPAVVTFIGDSNIAIGAPWICVELMKRDPPYLVVILSKPGAGVILPSAATSAVTSATPDFWRLTLQDALPKVATDSFVINLGINDASRPGTATTPGFSWYGLKIDHLMRQLTPEVPVLWTNLPCNIAPPQRAAGCREINTQLERAQFRWSNLAVLDWSSVARDHEYMLEPENAHYSEAGYAAWAKLVADALDERFPTT